MYLTTTRQIVKYQGKMSPSDYSLLEAQTLAEYFPSVTDLTEKQRQRACRLITNASKLAFLSENLIKLMAPKAESFSSIGKNEKRIVYTGKTNPELKKSIRSFRKAASAITLSQSVRKMRHPLTESYLQAVLAKHTKRALDALNVIVELTTFHSDKIGPEKTKSSIQNLLDAANPASIADAPERFAALFRERKDFMSQGPVLESFLAEIKEKPLLTDGTSFKELYSKLERNKNVLSNVQDRDPTILDMGLNYRNIFKRVKDSTGKIICEKKREFERAFDPMLGDDKNAEAVTSELLSLLGKYNALIENEAFEEQSIVSGYPETGDEKESLLVELEKIVNHDWAQADINACVECGDRVSGLAVSLGRVLTMVPNEGENILETGRVCLGKAFFSANSVPESAPENALVFCFSENQLLSPKDKDGGDFKIAVADGIRLLPRGYAKNNDTDPSLDLQTTPFKIMVHSSRMESMKNFLLNKSVFRERLQAAPQATREEWFGSHIVSYKGRPFLYDERNTPLPSSGRHSPRPCPDATTSIKDILKDMPPIYCGYLKRSGKYFRPELGESELLRFVPLRLSPSQYRVQEEPTAPPAQTEMTEPPAFERTTIAMRLAVFLSLGP